MADDFHGRLAAAARITGTTLDRLLAAKPAAGETARPAQLIAAMRYATLGAGKRLRPFLLIESARLFGATGAGVVRAAAALECIHCYSLVHDDLPAMDDDDLRRGRPTVHRAYDEATAILAGDALLTLAFATLADPRTHPDPDVRLALIAGLAAAAGVGGMAGGQMLDLNAEARPLGAKAVSTMQAMKTGALFRFACEAGAILGGASTAERQRLARFGDAFGLAFQAADDLIDATGSAARAGKATSKDATRGKATLVGLRGVDKAREHLAAAVEKAVAILAPFGAKAATLAAAARFAGNRDL